MQSRFTHFNLKDIEVTSCIDELPLWSAPFGMLLLQHIRLIPQAVILDIGCGTGFPLLEAVERLGRGCKAFGIDPWETALQRAEQKSRVNGIKNVSFILAKAEKLPFKDDTFDIILSNNGLNNVDDIDKTLEECFRTAKPGAQLLFTANLPGTMSEFYAVMKEIVSEWGRQEAGSGRPEAGGRELIAGSNIDTAEILSGIEKHIREKRKSVEETLQIVGNHGFVLHQVIEDQFQYRFIDGTAYLDDHFIRLAFLPAWENIIPPDICDEIFEKIEKRLNKTAVENQGLILNIPYACYDFQKSS